MGRGVDAKVDEGGCGCGLDRGDRTEIRLA
jgi:hypothetical protein